MVGLEDIDNVEYAPGFVPLWEKKRPWYVAFVDCCSANASITNATSANANFKVPAKTELGDVQ